MKFFYFISLFVFALYFGSCNRNADMSNRNAAMDSSQMDTIVCAGEDDTPLDSIIAKIEYVKLRSREDHPVGAIDNLMITPDHIIVADYNLSKSIFVFDRQGQIQTVISRLGRGPQEYLSISDVILTPDQKRIAVLDNHGKKILYYDLAGNFLFHKVTPFYPLRIKYLDEENMLLVTYGLEEADPGLASYPHNRDLLYCVDTMMRIRKSFMPNQFSRELSSYCSPNVRQFNNNRVYATHIYSDTIYQVTPEKMIPRYRIDLSPVDGIANFWEGLTPEKHKARMDKSFFTGNFFENDRFAIFQSFGGVPLVLFSKETKRCYYLGKRSSTALGLYVGSVEFAYKDRFITVMPAYQLLHITDSFADQRYQKLAAEIAAGLTEDDDPVLLFYTLREPNH